MLHGCLKEDRLLRTTLIVCCALSSHYFAMCSVGLTQHSGSRPWAAIKTCLIVLGYWVCTVSSMQQLHQPSEPHKKAQSEHRETLRFPNKSAIKGGISYVWLFHWTFLRTLFRCSAMIWPRLEGQWLSPFAWMNYSLLAWHLERSDNGVKSSCWQLIEHASNECYVYVKGCFPERKYIYS